MLKLAWLFFISGWLYIVLTREVEIARVLFIISLVLFVDQIFRRLMRK